MRKILLLLLVFAATASNASAQRRHFSRYRNGDDPAVYVISVKETDTVYPAENGQMPERHNAAAESAVNDHRASTRKGFQQAGMPSVIFANDRNTFSFAVGGYVNLRTAYGFNSIISDIDVIPYDVPVPHTYATKQKVEMDASTSRIFFRGIANTRRLGKVEIYFDFDFRGGAAGSYTPRLRTGYVSFLGLTFGRDVTTFCDLTASPQTIDFQGPNAYNFNFATMIRYEYSFLRRHMTIGAAAEMPNVSGTYGTTLAPIPQRIPDVPVYMQVSWGRHRQSHFRASAVFRGMYLRNVATGSSISLFGWGVQASGNIHVTRFLQFFFNGVYGEGITPYLQDLTGSGLDFTPNPLNPDSVQTTPMYGWQAAAQINILPNLFISGGYSTVTVCKRNGYYSADEYRQGQYMFGNIFWNVTRRFCVAAEYLHASRINMNDARNGANRVNFMMQYSF